MIEKILYESNNMKIEKVNNDICYFNDHYAILTNVIKIINTFNNKDVVICESCLLSLLTSENGIKFRFLKELKELIEK